MALLSDDLRPIALVGVVLAAFCYYTYHASSALEKFWRQEDFSGLPSGTFARFRGGLKSIKNCRAIVHDGYQKSLKTARGFAVPVFSSDPVYVLPAAHMREFISKPDSVLDAAPVQLETIQWKYTVGTDLMNSAYHFNIIRNQLTRKLSLFTNEIVEELALGFVAQWGRKSEWSPVNIYPTSMAIVSRAANRVFAGTALCRDETFLNAARDYTINIFTCGAIINLVPGILRPLLGPLIALPVDKQLKICYRQALPIIKERMALLEKTKRIGQTDLVPNDVITWLIEESIKVDAKRQEPDPLEYDAHRLCRRLLSLNMVAIHTTSIVSTNLVLDLFSSPDCHDMVAGLREEIDRVYRVHNNQWTKAAIDDLLRVDSVIRETLRYSPLAVLGMHRTVIDPDGVDFGNGVRIPKGAVVGTANAAIYQDERFYPRPDVFDAFRFSRPREEHLAKVKRGENASKEDDAERTLELKRLGLITTTDTFLGFGHGRHACPGRFFAAQEIKLMVIYMLQNYDIRLPGRSRPPNMELNHLCVPTDDATIEVRWRGSSV